MTNKAWIELLSAEWGVSKSVARNMLHAMYQIKEANSDLKISKPSENYQNFDETWSWGGPGA